MRYWVEWRDGSEGEHTAVDVSLLGQDTDTTDVLAIGLRLAVTCMADMQERLCVEEFIDDFKVESY